MTVTKQKAITLEPLHDGDRVLQAMLTAAGLPASDLKGAGKRFYGLRDGGGALRAVGGLEICGRLALLRSCVVDPARRGSGLGSALVEALVREAGKAGVREIYLLTETAEGFFAHLGFERVERQVVPPEIAGLSQFAGVCPASATAMLKRAG